MSIFKAYDIRGVYGKELNEETAYKLGLAYCEMRRKELKEHPDIVVGCDMRISSESLKSSLIKGLTEGGFNVVDIGLASTPTFYFSVAHFRYDGGILVSASHNPKEYNGFKLVRERAAPISIDTGMRLLESLVHLGPKPAAKKGFVMYRKDCLAEQIRHDLKHADLSRIKQLKIVVDPANSMGSLYFDALFSMLKCDVVRMNWELDGTFPAHEADPFKLANVMDLCKKVLQEKADFGIATDGDGDRIFFIDNNGVPVEPGILRAILCRIFLRDRPGAKIAYDIRPGKITEDTIISDGGIPVVTRVGHSLIKEQAVREGAYFAGESSGHYFLNMDEGCYEVPVIVTLRILQELSESNKSFSEYVKPYQKYFHSGEINFSAKDPKKKIEEIKERYSGAKITELDGVSVEYPDFWFNVRPSNTEPLVRLNLEAISPDVLEARKSELLNLLSG